MKNLFIILFLFVGIINLYSGSEPFWERFDGPSIGHVRDMAHDSDGNIYITSEYSVWKSSDLGENWSMILDRKGYPDNSPSIVRKVDVNKNNVIAVAENITRPTKVDILISFDHGYTWSSTGFKMDDRSDLLDIQWYGDNIYALIKRGYYENGTGIIKSYNLKDSVWTNFGDTIPNEVLDFSVLNDKSIAVARRIGINEHDVITSTDGGKYWETKLNTSRFINSICYQSPNKLYTCSSADFYKIENDKIKKTAFNTNDINSIDIDDKNRILLGSQKKVMISENDGDTFESYSKGLDLLEKASINKILNIGDVYFSNVGLCGVYKSTDIGMSWESSNNGFHSNFLNCLSFDRYDGSVYLASVGLYKSTNNGISWELIGFEGEFLYNVYVSKKNHLYVTSYIHESLMKSKDGGKSWKKVLNTRDVLNEICENSEGELFATSLGFSFLYRSFDGGDTWLGDWINPPSSGSGKNIAVNSEDHLFTSEDWGGVYRSTDKGDYWEKQLGEGVYGCFFEYDILFIPKTKYGFVSYDDCLYFTEDNGRNWKLRYFKSKSIMAVDSIGMIYVEDGSRIKRTDVWGNLIDDISEGLSDYGLSTMAVSPNGYVWAATDYGGVYRGRSPVVGVEEKDLINNNDITISPNPATEILTLSYSVSEPGAVQISLLDFLGRKAKEIPEKYIDSGIHKEIIDISQLQSGIYFLSVKTGLGVITKKVVVVGK